MLSCVFLLLTLRGAFAALVGPSPQQFEADITVYDDFSATGILIGHLYYDYTGQLMRIDWKVGPGLTGGAWPIEMIRYNDQLRHLFCTNDCDTSTHKEPMPVYFKSPSDVATGLSVGPCLCYSIVASGATTEVCEDANGLPCHATFAIPPGLPVGTPAKRMVFTNVGQLETTELQIWTTPAWSICPKRECNIVMDLELVLDESGSISGTDFNKMRSFALDIVNSYSVGPKAVNVGVTLFSSSSRVVIPLSNNLASITNAINFMSQQGGATCIGCGILTARQDMLNHGLRQNCKRVMIVLTDGGNNRPLGSHRSHLIDAVNQAEGIGAMLFGLGVADAQIEELQIIGSDIPGVTTWFKQASFNDLAAVMDQLITATCTDIALTPCGTLCLGFCSCDRSCLCVTCDTPKDACELVFCDAASGYACIKRPVDCNDNNACTSDAPCDPVLGCLYTTVICEDNDICTDPDTCDTMFGCVNPNISCDDSDMCTEDLCASPNPGCYHRDFTVAGFCSDGNMCTDDLCEPLSGCYHITTNCDDLDECTVDTCDIALGCLHVPKQCKDLLICTQDDQCDPAVGCIFPPTNCDDADWCTLDQCDEISGCTHTTIPCDRCVPPPPTPPVDCTPTATCMDGVCNDTDGLCYFSPRQCFRPNLCTDATCNLATDACVLTPVDCGFKMCIVRYCDLRDGLCKDGPLDCEEDPPNLCTVNFCNESKGTYGQCDIDFSASIVCPTVKCLEGHCAPTTGLCVYENKSCDSYNQCRVDDCDPTLGTNGECVQTPRDCLSELAPNKCYRADCSTASGCSVTSFDLIQDPCDDFSLCTYDYCNESIGCIHEDLCAPLEDNCTVCPCTTYVGCICQPRECEPTLWNKTQDCFYADCDMSVGCRLHILPGAVVDICGNCNGNSSMCYHGMTRAEITAIGVAAGILAVIIIAAIVFVACVAISSKVTYDLYMRSRQANMDTAHENPMYEGSGREGRNPLYDGTKT